MTSHVDLDALVLKNGGHHSREDGVCFMEAVAWWAHEPHSDHPDCVSPVLGAFLRQWNDSLDDEGRQRLKPYIPKVVGTAGEPEADSIRGWMCVDWFIHHHVPAWLTLAGLTEHAERVAALPSIMDDAAAEGAQPVLSAAWSAAESAAWSAAESAAWSAAESAAESAAWSAARSAAESAAWSAAESAAESAARSAAESAAESAAWSAARSALEPTRVSLQQSAFDLLDAMLAVRAEQPA